MAIASWMIRGRSLRSGRFNRGRLDSDDENVQLDLSKDPKENVQEIFNHVCQRHGVVEGKRLGYLNAFVKLVSQPNLDLSELGYNKEELLCCLRTALVHEASQVRAAGLRAVRYLLKDESDVKILLKLQIPTLISRSLDLALRNDMERIQAMRIMRRVLALSPNDFPVCFVRCLISLSNGAIEAKDRMFRASLGILAEVCVLNPFLVLKCGGIASIVRNVLDCGLSRVSESLVGCLLYLLDRPETRVLAQIDLQCLAEPFCDFYFHKSTSTSGDRTRDERRAREREIRLQASHYALLSVLRSWPGLLQFCNPFGKSGLRAIVDVLYLKQLDIRKAILDLLYDLLGIPLPEWTDEFSVALDAVDPSHPQDAWRLNEGFIAAEGRAILPHLSRFRPNIVVNHLAVLLQAFLEVGLLSAIIEVIVAEDTFLSVRATILLGQLLHMMHLLLPPECCNITPPLPTLMWYAVGASYEVQNRSCGSWENQSPKKTASASLPGAQSTFTVSKRNQQQALASVAAMNQLHRLLKRRPAPASLFLAQILNSASRYQSEARRAAREAAQKSQSSGSDGVNISETVKRVGKRQRRFSESMLAMGVRGKYSKSKIQQMMAKESEDALKGSHVLSNKDGFSWDWDVIRSILKSRSDPLLKLEDSNHRIFIKRLVHYYKPSSNCFSRVELSNRRNPNIYTLAGIELIDVLLRADEVEGSKLLSDFLGDLSNEIEAILLAKSAHDCLLSPQQTTNSLCQDYFLFIGHLCQSMKGLKVLESNGFFDLLLRLVMNTNHDCYIKLVVSSLDYAVPAKPREILETVLTSGSESSRLYTTQFLVVLLRAKVPNFQLWGLPLVLRQLKDKSKSVRLSALAILDEACDEPLFLHALAELNPTFDSNIERELLIQIRLLSTPVGFSTLHEAGFTLAQMEFWSTEFNYRYVRFVEGEIHDSLSLHQRGEDGHYNRRVSSSKHTVKDVFVPPHLYGQLTQVPEGFQLMAQDPRVLNLFQIVKSQQCSSDEDILELKAALWAVGSIAISTSGLNWLSREGVIQSMVALAQNCSVYSIRSTSFYAISLVATTSAGADVLLSLGWMTVRHHRLDPWPVIYLSLQPPLSFTTVQEEVSSQLTAAEDEIETESSIVTEEDDSSLWDDSASRNGVQFWNEASPCPGEILASRKARTLPYERAAPDWLRKQQRSFSESQSGSPQLQRLCSPISSLTTASTGGDVNSPSNAAVGESVSASAIASSSTASMTKTFDDSKSRSNSCSDSGVCSCDSTLAKQTSDRVQTLSPIPSSTSLNTLKSSSAVYAPVTSATPATPMQQGSQLRRTSLQGSITSEHLSPTHSTLSSRLSQQDVAGYATLRYLQQQYRPQLPSLLYNLHGSFGAADHFLDDLNLLSSSTSSRGRSVPSSILSSMRRLKVRSLDRQSTHPLFLNFDTKLQGDVSNPLTVKSLPTKSSQQQNPNQCYMGIALPLLCCSLYPASQRHSVNDCTTEIGVNLCGPQTVIMSDHEDVTSDIQVETRSASREQRRVSLSCNEMEKVRETGEDSELPRSLQPSSDSEDELESEEGGGGGSRLERERVRAYRKGARSNRGTRAHIRRRRDRNSEYSYMEVRPYIHQTNSCLVCSIRQSHLPTTGLRERKISAGSYQARPRTETESSCGTAADPQESPSRQRTISSGMFGGSLESTTSVETVGSTHDSLPGGQCVTRAMVRAEVMRHVECMSNPIMMKVCKQALLQAKQKYPQMLDDICLYSDICDSLATCGYRLQARRFLQEIFLDMSFVEIYEEAVNILKVPPVAASNAECPTRSISVSLPPSEGLVLTGAVKVIESQNLASLSMVLEEHSGSEEHRGSISSAPSSLPRQSTVVTVEEETSGELPMTCQQTSFEDENETESLTLPNLVPNTQQLPCAQSHTINNVKGTSLVPVKKTVFSLLSQIDTLSSKKRSESDRVAPITNSANGEELSVKMLPTSDYEEPRSPVKLLSCRLQSGDCEDVMNREVSGDSTSQSPTRVRKVATVCQPSMAMLQSDSQSKS